MTDTPRYMKRVYAPRTFFRFMHDGLSYMGDMRSAGANGVDRRFGERIMLAVTEVNGCRYCSYYHTRLAIDMGVSQDEVNSLMSGELAKAPHEQQTALLFAQHYAEQAGKPDEAAVRKLVDTYGLEMSRSITAYICMIMIGNAYGNSFDALRHRFRGTPAAGSSLGQELGVLVGTVFMIPGMMIRRFFQRKPGGAGES